MPYGRIKEVDILFENELKSDLNGTNNMFCIYLIPYNIKKLERKKQMCVINLRNYLGNVYDE